MITNSTFKSRQEMTKAENPATMFISLSLISVILIGMLPSKAASQTTDGLVVGTSTLVQERRFYNREDCESGTVAPYGGHFFSPDNDGMLFGKFTSTGKFRVNCNVNALEIDDDQDGKADRSIPLPACEPEYPGQPENDSISQYDCVDETDFDVPFFSQKRYEDEGCPTQFGVYSPVMGLTEECLDRPKSTLSPDFGAIRASCLDVPGKLAIHYWLADRDCGGDPDYTEEFELGGTCDKQISPTEIRYVLSACQAEMDEKSGGISLNSNIVWLSLASSMTMMVMASWMD